MRKLALLLLLCGFAPSASATIAHVAHDCRNAAGSNTTLACTVTSSTAGNLLVVGATTTTTTTTITVSGNGSGSFTASTAGKVCRSTTICAELFFIQNCTGGDTTITVTYSGTSANIQMAYQEFSGAATSGGEDGTASSSGNSGTSLATGTLTSVGTADVVVGFGASATSSSPNTWTAAASFTLNAGIAENRSQSEWRVFTAAVSQTITMTDSQSAAWVMVADAFKVASGVTAHTMPPAIF